MLAPLHIEVRYDTSLQQITGRESEPVIISDGAVFAYLLHNIFLAHPEIGKRYPPGTIGMLLNGLPPKIYTPIFDGDIIELSASHN